MTLQIFWKDPFKLFCKEIENQFDIIHKTSGAHKPQKKGIVEQK